MKENENQEPDFMENLDKAADQKLADRQEEAGIETLPPGETRPDDDGAGADEAPADGDRSSKEGDGSDGDGDPDENAIPDELLTRAVKADIPIEEARQYPSAELLEKACSRQETAKNPEGDGDQTGDGEGDEEPGEKSPLDAIPDLDPDEVDESIVAAFSGLKEFAGKLFEENKALKEKGDVSPAGSWTDAKFSDLGKEFESVFGKGDAADLPGDSHELRARKRLERHMDYLREDAKEEGETLSRADAFKKALESLYGDVVKKAKSKATAEAARKRSRRVVNQPRKTNGAWGSDDEYGNETDRKDDAVAAVAGLMENEA